MQGRHPFPSRTRWLRPVRPMVPGWRRPGRAGGRQHYGGVAQLGEHLPCKQGVMSSNLTISIKNSDFHCFLYLENCIRKYPRNNEKSLRVWLESTDGGMPAFRRLWETECPETIRIISQIQDIRGSYLSDNSRRWTDSEQACLQSWLNIRRPNGNRVRSMRSSDESTRFSERIRKRRARRSRMLSRKLR